MRPRKPKSQKKVKAIKAWAIQFYDDRTLCPSGHIPTLFDTRIEARKYAEESGFRDNDEYRARPVRVTITVESK